MKIKHILLVVLCMILAATLAVAGTIAYLTDRDSEANIFTLGNVDIDLTEDFEQGSTLIPGKDIEKVVKIKNTGKTDAWVWYTYAVPTALINNSGNGVDAIHFELANNADWTSMGIEHNIDINNIMYSVVTVLHNASLAPGATTLESLKNVYLDSHIDIDPDGNFNWVDRGVVTPIDWNINEDGAPIIYVNAYAVQKDGFENVNEAYAAYADQWGSNPPALNGEYPINVAVTNADEFVDALANSELIYVMNDITLSGDIANVEDDDAIVIDLKGNTVSNLNIDSYGDITVKNGTVNSEVDAFETFGSVTLSDLKVNAGSTADYAIINHAGSDVVLNNVVLDSKGGGIGVVDGAKVVFNSGSVAVNTKSTSGRYNFYLEGNGSVLTINGGDFSFSKTLNQKRAYIYAGDGTTVYVNGGNFGPASTRSGYTAGILTAGSGKVIITGGTFGFDPSAWVAVGYQAVKDGSIWTVSAIN